jgi:uncharacterized repeat protein (TIGR03803 family)
MRKCRAPVKAGWGFLTALLLLLPGAAGGASLTTLFEFPGGAGGQNPLGLLVFDGNGALYGTTSLGGTGCAPVGCGMVFQLSPSDGGQWQQTVLHNFTGATLCGNQICFDGDGPAGDLVFDGAGALYGTTVHGGTFNFGTVFQLSPPADAGGEWTETVLYSFSGDPSVDGGHPGPSLVFDGNGALYGVTEATVFQLVPPSDAAGAWNLNVLAYFTGGFPVGGVQFDGSGVLYGPVSSGSTHVGGSVFSLTPPRRPGGSWRHRLVYAFPPSLAAGGNPGGGVIVDGAGTLYGTTLAGGSADDGVVFRLVPPANPGTQWFERVLHNFMPPPDARFPNAPLTFGPGKILYGTSGSGGDFSDFGTVFQVVRGQGVNVLWSFRGPGSGGNRPKAGVILDGSGALYGTTSGGGDICACGTVYMLIP